VSRSGVRVVAGAHRGRRLRVPEGRDVRPTADRVKEAVFSILGNRVAAARVLDLFAGSGALGIEALSRGASEVWFVEVARKAMASLRSNLEAVRSAECSRVIQDDALRPDRWAADEAFDLVFADPPYRKDLGPAVLDAFTAHLAPGGMLILEHERGIAPAHPGWRLLDARQYGDTSVSFYALSGGEN